MSYFIGILIIGVGFLLVWKAGWLMNNVGRIAWADQHLGSEGGSRLFYQLLGILAILLSFLFMSGLGWKILNVIFGKAGV